MIDDQIESTKLSNKAKNNLNHFNLRLVLPEIYTSFPLYDFIINHRTSNFDQFLWVFASKNGEADKTK